MDPQHSLTACVKRNASDLHLKAGSRPIVRVHGHLESQDDLPAVTRDFMRKSAMNMLGEIRYNALMEGEEMDLAHTVPGTGRFRINLFLCQGDVRAVLRHIPEHIPAFEGLHLPKVLERLSQERRGLILVTGITGSGKSTTLAAMLDFMSFAQALRAALRQDPDIILVGEMRDAETMEVALHAAETGHLVLSTLHTLNATETINRIISIFPPHQEDQIRAQLSAVIQGVVSQRLVVRADGKGRVPAVEVMIMTGLVRDSIREKAKTPQIPNVIASGQAQYGMQTFDQSLLGLYRDELITYETARDAATNPDDFDLKVKGIFSTGEMTWDANGGGGLVGGNASPAPGMSGKSSHKPPPSVAKRA